MGLGVEYNVAEVEGVGWREEQVEVFESLGEEKTLHRVCLFFSDHAFQSGVSVVSAAILDEVSPELPAYFEVAGIFRVLIKVVSGFDDFRPQRITGRGDLARAIVKLFRLDTRFFPHRETRLLQSPRAFQIT